jgi:hypothetical protein
VGSVGSPAWTVNAARPLKRTGLCSLRSRALAVSAPREFFGGRSRNGAAWPHISCWLKPGACPGGGLADEAPLRAARPHFAVWIDKLWHAGHLVFAARYDAAPTRMPGFRVDVGGCAMTISKLWAGFRSALGGGEVTPRSVESRQNAICRASKKPGLSLRESRAYVFKRGSRICFPLAAVRRLECMSRCAGRDEAVI